MEGLLQSFKKYIKLLFRRKLSPDQCNKNRKHLQLTLLRGPISFSALMWEIVAGLDQFHPTVFHWMH